MGTGDLSGVMELKLDLVCGNGYKTVNLLKYYWIVHLQWEDVMVYKLYPKEAVFKNMYFSQYIKKTLKRS